MARDEFEQDQLERERLERARSRIGISAQDIERIKFERSVARSTYYSARQRREAERNG